MKTIIERIENEIIDRIKSLQIHLDDEFIFCELTASEQEKIVENIKQELKKLENLVLQNIHQEIRWQEIEKTQEYQDEMERVERLERMEEFQLEMWKETDEAQDTNPKIKLNLITRIADEALIMARKMLNERGYTHAIVSNVNESMQIVRNDKKQEIITYNINAKTKAGQSES
ncbi:MULTISPECIES: hypothetical protein [Helicobacter]|uniref:Uncharacterized protein n=1 Tax=Helicobacter bilis ATCC 43879 TaxID=613026 RepID=C3XFM4_9HELI|nr:MULTISPECIES: hypothetical protein [Helicobacter]EEO23813.1 hypothetical protein HRAG_00870 [Helicobacter bilis ATCC 43879]